MKTIKRDNADIAYDVAGRGELTLFFVHGSFIDRSWWNAQVQYFENHYCVVTMDLPGHGQSGKERTNWSVQGFADDVVAVIKKEDLQNVILIGHSLAGDINLIAATTFPAPIIGFIGIDNFKNAGKALPPDVQKQAAEILQKLETSFPDTNEQYARMALLTPATPPEITTRVVEAYRKAYKPMGVPIAREAFDLAETERKLLPKLGLKLHLINVDYFPTNELALKELLILQYDLRYLHGTSHYPMLENPSELNRLLEETIVAISSDAKKIHHTVIPIPH